MSYRTHHCNELRPKHAGETATLVGWVNTVRDHHGVIFIDIRDREGVTQCVFRTEENAEAARLSMLRQEDVVQVTGRVASARRSTGIHRKREARHRADRGRGQRVDSSEQGRCAAVSHR